MARLFSLKGGRVRKLQAFEGVYVDECDRSLAERQVQALVLRYGPTGVVTRKAWVADCPEGNFDMVNYNFRPAEP